MINWLHTWQPNPILANLGPINIYWYGFLIVMAIIVAILITIYLAKKYQISTNTIIDLSFWLIFGGIIGARIYEIFLFFPYYSQNPADIIKVWQGGLAIHGAIIAGLIIVYLFAKKIKVNFWQLTAIIVPGLALGQAIGRWGNYFNMELFGRPTFLSWGIPINIIHRPAEYISFNYFHPAFLYESIGNLIIFLILILIHVNIIKRNKTSQYNFVLITAFYLILYSALRFSLEFIRLDETPLFLSLRWPQIISLIIILFSAILITINKKYAKHNR